MEDIIALVLVVGIFALFAWGVTTLIKRMKREKERQAERQAAADKYWKEQREKINVPDRWNKVTPQQYADAMPKRKPAMKKANNVPSYANTPMSSTSSTSTGSLDIGDVITGALVLNELFGHKSESSHSSSKSESSSSSWGLDDDDSRKSISSSMDTSSSWSSSDSSSSDSGPSSDW